MNQDPHVALLWNQMDHSVRGLVLVEWSHLTGLRKHRTLVDKDFDHPAKRGLLWTVEFTEV